MPGTDDTNDLDLDLDEDEGNEGDPPEGESTDEPDAKPKAGDDKRISALQSKADSETSRANKAEKALEALQKQLTRGEGEGAGKPDPERQALLSELREASLDAVFGEYPELKKFGIDRDLVEGQTRAQMRENAASLVALIKSVSTAAKNEALKEHGITPEPAGSKPQPKKSYADMSAEDIEKEIVRARDGGGSLFR